MNTIALRRAARRFNLGAALYWFYFLPRNKTRDFVRYGGPLVRRRMQTQREEMIEAAWKLPPMRGWRDADEPLDVYFMTGEKHWHETAFCFATLCHHSDVPLRLVLIDDGSITARIEDHARSIFPHVHIHHKDELNELVAEKMPRDQFPTLREWRERQPLLRKLTDLHSLPGGWKLLLDSDMIFFRRPDFLLDWLSSPAKPIYMYDVKNAYGFTHELRYSLVQKPIHDRINIGIFGLKSNTVDFARLEHWLATMIAHEQCPYNVTQGLVSMILAGVECDVAPPRDYIVMPSRGESPRPQAVMHHYVADSRRWYMDYGWRIAARELKGMNGEKDQ